MKLTTIEEMCNIDGAVIWGYYNKGEFPQQLFIQYNRMADKSKPVHKRKHSVEPFPITTPYHYDGAGGFTKVGCGVVDDTSISSDYYPEKDMSVQVVVYDSEDILEWVRKLNTLLE